MQYICLKILQRFKSPPIFIFEQTIVKMISDSDLQRCGTKAFWGSVAAGEHVVQFYDSDNVLLNALADYAVDGFYAGDSVIVIATGRHIDALNSHLRVRGLILDPLFEADQYIPLDAGDTLDKFMINGMPDERYFMEMMSGVMKRARKGGRHIRAFGEMVAILWEGQNTEATVQLEFLWNKFYEREKLCLFCAYPKSSLADEATAAVRHICAAHSKQIESYEDFPSQIFYRTMDGHKRPGKIS
jgi:hypothetical protein